MAGTAWLTMAWTLRTQMCKFYEVGQCTRGDRCTFAHGSEQLRPLDVIYIYMCGVSGTDYMDYKPLILIWGIYALCLYICIYIQKYILIHKYIYIGYNHSFPFIYLYIYNYIYTYGIKHCLDIDCEPLILSAMFPKWGIPSGLDG